MYLSAGIIFRQHQASHVTNSKKRRQKMIQYLVQMLLIALTISLCCIAIFATTWPGMIFHRLSIVIENKIVSFCNKRLARVMFLHRISMSICKPLFRCPICMSSFWTITAWIISGFSFNLLLMMLLVCGLNTILTSLIANILPDE